MDNQNISTNSNVCQDTINLVVARIDATLSPNLKMAKGFEGSLDKQKMIEHVKKGDKIGQRIIKSHINFMRAQASGQLTTALNTVL